MGYDVGKTKFLMVQINIQSLLENAGKILIICLILFAHILIVQLKVHLIAFVYFALRDQILFCPFYSPFLILL